MSKDPETQWREAYESYRESEAGGGFNTLAMPAFRAGYRAGYLASSPKRPEVEEKLRGALKRLTYAAETSGGTAGRDEYLCACIAEAKAALIYGEPKTDA